MTIVEEKGDLFTLDNSWAKAHCISQDAVMGMGIAKTFCFYYPGLQPTVRRVIEANKLCYPITVAYFSEEKEQLIFNLVTKEMYYNKPTYETMAECLKQLVYLCKTYDVKKLAMPKIGSGLDKLSWTKVKANIIETFQDTDIEISIRVL